MIKDIVEDFSKDDVKAYDHGKFLIDMAELDKIYNSYPKDNVLELDDCTKMQMFSMRGMNICDDWIPIMHVAVSVVESNRDKAKAKAYINAESDSKMTAEFRKAYSECDEEYNRLKILAEKIKATKIFLEKKRDSFKTAYYFFRDQFNSSTTSGKNNSGESLPYDEGGEQKTTRTEPSFGRKSW